jgi:hypothetical protein
MKVAVEATFERGQTDTTPQTLQIRQARPDFIIACLYEAETAIFLNDLKKYGVTAPVMRTAGTDLQNTVKRVGDVDTVKNYLVPHNYVDNTEGPRMKKWNDIILKYYPNETISGFSAISIGSGVAVVEALKRVGRGVTREKFLAEMDGIRDFETGVLSGKITWTPTDRDGVKEAAVAGFINGNPAVLNDMVMAGAFAAYILVVILGLPFLPAAVAAVALLCVLGLAIQRGLFKELGVGIVQMTYNTQNLVGCGCYETRDSGLSDWGREVVAEMNRVGMLCDLSHVGPKTSEDVILASNKPVAYSHCLPAGLKAHPRNKSDEQLKFIVEHGGFVGVTMFPPFLRRGTQATVDDYVEAIEYVINLCGEDQVGIGTDFTQDYDKEFFDWITHDKGHARRLTDFGEVINPEGLRTIGEMPNLTAAMERRGWPEAGIRKVMGDNWLALLRTVWGA